MAVINVGTIIDKALTRITGNIPRPTLVVWFNEVVDDILSQPREWKFLTEPITLPITDSQITIPAGVSEVISIQVGDTVFTPSDQLGARDAVKIDSGESALLSVSGILPPHLRGYTLDAAGVITFHPGLSGSAVVTVENDITTDYTDEQDTIFPGTFQGLFISGLRKAAYNVDKDGRYAAESAEYNTQLSQVIAWDNRLKARPSWNPRGYVRSGQ